MSKVRGKDTSLELSVRRLIWHLGYRYRLYNRDLPGSPDLVFRKRKKVIYVHGCFWHRHDCAAGKQVPKSRRDFWISKLTRNAERDKEILEALRVEGWDVLVIWGCQLKRPDLLISDIQEFLGPISI